jgi:hypothetical protein
MPTVLAHRVAGPIARTASILALLTLGCVAGCTEGSGSTESAPSAPTSAVTLQWARPTSNEDGSALTDLAGYKVYYGQSPDLLTRNVDVHGAAVSSVEFRDLDHGSWYFAIASYNTAGVESSKSGIVSTTI